MDRPRGREGKEFFEGLAYVGRAEDALGHASKSEGDEVGGEDGRDELETCRTESDEDLADDVRGKSGL